MPNTGKAVPVANIHRLPLLLTPNPLVQRQRVRQNGVSLLDRVVTLQPYSIVPSHFVEVRALKELAEVANA